MPRFLPVTAATADDLERFSGRYGTFRWCSCMRWRLRSTPFRDSGKDGRAAALAGQVRAGQPVGILAYAEPAEPAGTTKTTGTTEATKIAEASQAKNEASQAKNEASQATDEASQATNEASQATDEPIGWCSVAPRESYAAIGASRVIPHLPGDQVWSVACFFVAPKARHQGLREGLLDAACQYAAAAGALTLEAYPSPDGKAYRYMGTRELYLKAGFRDVDVDVEANEATSRPVMRKAL